MGVAGIVILRVCLLILVALLGCACGRTSHPGPVRHYPVTGKIVSVDVARQAAIVDAAAIPNFMEAMTMEYPVPAQSDLDQLKAGENVRATVNVYADDYYDLSAVKVVAALPK